MDIKKIEYMNEFGWLNIVPLVNSYEKGNELSDCIK
jgi:hypothetical protein